MRKSFHAESSAIRAKRCLRERTAPRAARRNRATAGQKLSTTCAHRVAGMSVSRTDARVVELHRRNARQRRWNGWRCPRLRRDGGVSARDVAGWRDGVSGWANYGGVSPNDVPGYRVAEAFRGAESMDRAGMSPVWKPKDAGGGDVSTPGHLRRWIVRLRKRVIAICKVHPERSEGSAFSVIMLSSCASVSATTHTPSPRAES